MTCGNLFRLQMAAAMTNKRQVALRVGVSTLLATPFIFVDMGPRAQTIGIVMVILFTGFFGAATAHARLRSDLRYARLTLLPIPRPTIWLDLILASILARLTPVLIVLTAFVAVNAQSISPASIPTLLGLLCGCLLVLTLLGMAIGTLARTNGEVHLLGALTVALLAFVSGITPLPHRLIWLKMAAKCNPIAMLLDELNRLSIPESSIPPLQLIPASIMLAAVAIAAAARWIAGREHAIEQLDSHQPTVNNNE